MEVELERKVEFFVYISEWKLNYRMWYLVIKKGRIIVCSCFYVFEY